MGVETAIIAAITVASSAASIAASSAQRSASRKQAAYINAQQKSAYEKSVAVNQAQVEVSALERRRQLQARYDAFKGAAAVSAAERGVAEGRSAQAIQTSFGIQAARESAKITMENALNQQSFAISNQPMWQVGQSTSPFLSGIQGGLQGLSMGASLAGSMNNLSTAQSMSQIGSAYPTLNTSIPTMQTPTFGAPSP